MPRSRLHLEQAVATAANERQRAVALYELGVFHDNNSREAEAIPCYEEALSLGLDPHQRGRARAWLASSFFKTGRRTEARLKIAEALADDCPTELRNFLLRLQRRITRIDQAGRPTD